MLTVEAYITAQKEPFLSTFVHVNLVLKRLKKIVMPSITLFVASCTMCSTCGESWSLTGLLYVVSSQLLSQHLHVFYSCQTFIEPSFFTGNSYSFLFCFLPFPAHVFTVRSVNESHVMCCFVIVQLNSSCRQHTPVFSSPLRGTGHDPSNMVPLPLPTVLPSSHPLSLSK